MQRLPAPCRTGTGRAVALWLGMSLAAAVAAETIGTDQLLQPWPHQQIRELEIGRDPVRWRQQVSREHGLRQGVQFAVPLPLAATWELANRYDDVGRTTPGVTAVRYLERTERRQVIQIDMKVLWKRVTLTFEIEQDPPREVRFRWRDDRVGELVGACLFQEAAAAVPTSSATAITFVTQFTSRRPVPMGLLAAVERIAMLQAVKSFLRTCEQQV